MIRRAHLIWLLTVLLAVTPALAASKDSGKNPASDRKAVPEPPPPPRNYQPPETPGGDDLEPEVTIKTQGTEVHEEYRFNGQLYMVKVTPAKGKPYYLIYDERGTFRRSDLESNITVPTWVIKRF